MKGLQHGNIGRAATIVMLSLIGTVACYAQAASGGGRLAGTWDIMVTVRDCTTWGALNTFPSIANFNQGGTSTGSTSGLPQSSRTPDHGVWKHVQGNTYMFKAKSFNFNAEGVAVSYMILTHELILDETANTYYSAGTARFYLMNGTQVGQGCSDAVGTRFDL